MTIDAYLAFSINGSILCIVSPFPVDPIKNIGIYVLSSSLPSKAGRCHPIANKPLKKALRMCAISVIRIKRELRNYFDRKVKKGENKFCDSFVR